MPLSKERCRRAFPQGESPSDSELATLRDQLTLLAEVVVEAYETRLVADGSSKGTEYLRERARPLDGPRGRTDAPGSFFPFLSEEAREAFDERAAIVEFEAGLPRAIAEEMALREVVDGKVN